MARSKYVYMILDPGLPPLGFTVKGELGRWLGGHPDPGGRTVWRGRDGIVKTEAVLLSPGEILALTSSTDCHLSRKPVLSVLQGTGLTRRS